MADGKNIKPDPTYVAVIITILISIVKNLSNLQFFPNLPSLGSTLLLTILLLPIVLLLLYKRPSLVEKFSFRENEDYFIAKTGSSEFVVGAVSIFPEEGTGGTGTGEEDFYLKTRGLVNGLLKAGVSTTFVTHMLPSGNRDEDVLLAQLLVVSREIGREGVDEAVKMLRTDFEKIRSVYNTVFPELKLVRLTGKELVKYLRRILVDDSVAQRVDASNSIRLLTPHMPDDELCFLPSSYRPSADAVENRETIDLGWIVFNGSSIIPFRLDVDKFKKHMAVYGSTGSGKTTTVKHVLRGLAELKYPFMVLDWHNEYGHLAEELNGIVFKLGSFSLDILNPVEASSLSEHVAIVTDIFDQIYSFTPSQSYMFREVLLQTLAEKELGIPASNSLSELVETLERWSIKSFYENETKFALLRRLRPLITGQSREIFCNTSKLVRISDIVDRNVVFELGDIVEVDIRKLVSLFILAQLYEFRAKNKSVKSHFTVVEEAHNILPYRRRDSPPGIAEKLFLEMRKFNESLILVSQFPSQISPEIVKSTSLKISHRICEGEESRVLTDIMGLSPWDYELLKKQTPGYGFLTAEGFSKPVLFTIRLNEKESSFSQGSLEGSQPSQPHPPYT
jgi:energy-coupling factor transporter ATP-binding protein EcfA2